MPTDPSMLLAVVEAQGEIAASDLDLDAVMALVCAKARELTGADGAVVEVAGRPCARDGARPGADTASTLRVALVDRGAHIGVLTVVSARRSAFSERDEGTLSLLSGLVAAQLRHAQVYSRAEQASRVDTLTGLSNHRAYGERLDAEVARAIRHGRPLTLCLIELDGPQRLAADHGPGAVNSALVRVARALCAVRACDQAFRIDEMTFALLLPETTERDADVVLRRLHASLAVRDASGYPIRVLAARKQARHRDVDVLLDSVQAELERIRRAPRRLPAAA